MSRRFVPSASALLLLESLEMHPHPSTEESVRVVTPDALQATSSSEGEPMPKAKYSNGIDIDQPSPRLSKAPRLWWEAVMAEWRYLFAVVMPLLVGAGVMSMLASKSQVDAVKLEAAANLDVTKADIKGQFNTITVEVGALKTAVGDLRSDMKEAFRELRTAVLARQHSEADASSPPSPPPPFPPSSIPSKHPRAIAGKKEKTGQSSLFGLFGH